MEKSRKRPHAAEKQKVHVLRFRETDREIFEAIKDGRKRIETRAASTRYAKIKAGEKVLLVCGNEKFEKTISGVEFFKSVRELVKKYQPREINPKVETEEELMEMYGSFPNYREKIRLYGLAVMTLKNEIER